MRNILCASLLAFLSACGNDNGGPAGLLPDAGSGCSVQPTFTSVHDDLLSTNRCAIPGCHVEATPSANRGDLDFSAGKQAVYDALLSGGTFNAAASGELPQRVVMSSAMTSYLYEKVSKATPVGGGSGRMPPGLPLEDCQIQAIRDWIDGGAAND